MAQGSRMILAHLVCVFLCVASVTARTLARKPEPEPEPELNSPLFDVSNYGVHADGVTDDSRAFTELWEAGCASSGDVRLRIPPGTYFLNPIKFRGPCPNVNTITLYQEGHLKASTDLSEYVSGNDWVEFSYISGLRITGGGTFDGQGHASWSYDECSKKKYCKVLPTSVLFFNLNDTIVYGMKSINPKFFHIGVLDCHKFYATEISINAPQDSPNTDGIHIERSSQVTINNVIVGTGDDCISIGQGNTGIFISNITCGPGHGISIGSLGKYSNEGDVQGIIVRDSTISNTMNGVRIKTWQGSPSNSSASYLVFKNIQMKNVNNPIIIDQTYCPQNLCEGDTVPSRVSISNVSFKNITGTSASPVAVTLNCSSGTPCQNINLKDIQLKYVGDEQPTAVCAFADTHYSGLMLPSPCK